VVVSVRCRKLIGSKVLDELIRAEWCEGEVIGCRSRRENLSAVSWGLVQQSQ
jgi:hypothetical protein